MSRLYPILFLAFLFTSCNRNKNTASPIDKVNDFSKSIEKDIPVYKSGRSKGEPLYLFTAITRDGKDLGLKNLENGYDSLEIRVWLGHSLAANRHVVVVQRDNKEWRGQLISFTIGFDTTTHKSIVYKNEIKRTPKSGWKNFIKTLLSYGITTLPHEDDLPSYNGCGTDGLPYYFEISTSKKYRFYYYCNIEDNIKKFPEAKNVDNIGRLLEEEFEFEFTK